MQFIDATDGYIRLKVACPSCGRRLQAHVKLNTDETLRQPCPCGRAMLVYCEPRPYFEVYEGYEGWGNTALE